MQFKSLTTFCRMTANCLSSLEGLLIDVNKFGSDVGRDFGKTRLSSASNDSEGVGSALLNYAHLFTFSSPRHQLKVASTKTLKMPPKRKASSSMSYCFALSINI